MPDGEFFTGPVEDSVNGEVAFSFPATYGGREVAGVRFEFEDGKVVDASAEQGEDFLIEMLDTDEGARRLGELGIGTNYGIATGTKEILLDEKIGGTVHMAIGMSLSRDAAARTTRPSTGTWSATCARAARSPSTARSCSATASSWSSRAAQVMSVELRLGMIALSDRTASAHPLAPIGPCSVSATGG